jgi:predicted nucleotidyltransferase
VDLASRASVTQSVISAYESGQRQPSLPALARLVDASGFELTLGLRRQPGRLRRLPGPVGRRVRHRREDLVAAAAAHGVTNLRVFGSVARGEDRPGSDVDLLADFPSGLGRLETDLEGIPAARVDLIPAADLKPGVRQRAGSDLIPPRVTGSFSGWPVSRPRSTRSALTCDAATCLTIFDAVRIRLLEIGEAVKALPDDLLATNHRSRGGRSPVCATTSPTATLILHTRSCRPPWTKTCPASNAPSKP